MVKLRSHKVMVLLLAAAIVSGCSTTRPKPSGRSGLFDRAPAHSRSSAPGVLKKRDAETRDEKLDWVILTAVKRKATRWAPPLRDMQITSRFGMRGGDFHEGIDLRAPVGTPVHAVEGGTVAYAGSRISGYGRMVVVKHGSGLATLYAHNSRLLVRAGQKVARGQRIALSGKSGRATGPHVHFEVRSGLVALDPAEVLQVGRRTRVADVRAAPEAEARAPANRGRSPSAGSGTSQSRRSVRAQDTVRTRLGAANVRDPRVPPSSSAGRAGARDRPKRLAAAASSGD
jgi:murein DD-endopeptidase MepM/ murein hydrolase activator NlpD